MGHPLEEILSRLASAASDSSEGRVKKDGRGNTMPREVAALELSGVAARYLSGNPFKPGDLVTPRKGFNVIGDGEPHVVVDVFDRLPVGEQTIEGHGNQYPRPDMRIIAYTHDAFVPFLGESWCYEFYTGPIADVN